MGVSPRVSEEFVNFLIEEGFHVEESTAKWKYGVFFEEETSEFSALQRIESSDAQVVRIWRWPFNARCALCITGDIDALTLWDFILRPFEMRIFKKRRIRKKRDADTRRIAQRICEGSEERELEAIERD